MKTKFITTLVLAASLLLAGCQSTEVSDTKKVAARLAVTYATMKVIENNPAYGKRIVAIATEVEAAAGGDSASTVALLGELIKAKINWGSMSPADSMLVGILVDEVVAQLAERIGTGKLEGPQLLAIKEVAGWIKQAAVVSS
jgi:hypothetical protein